MITQSPTLAIVAHPDDEVLGCGGTIARMAKEEGHEVYIAIRGEGITSRYQNRDQADHALIDRLRFQSQKVAELLGARNLFLYSLPDNRFDTVPLIDVIKIIEELIERLQPKVIYTHHGGDLNIDHVITHRAVMTATRPVVNCPVKEIYAFEVLSSTEWAFGQFQSAFQPNMFVDISATLETKIQAMQIYESETWPFPHPRSPEALQSLGKRWGSAVAVGAAEAFEIIREIR